MMAGYHQTSWATKRPDSAGCRVAGEPVTAAALPRPALVRWPW